uniref:Uncharacterized protein n=1 Tax=viral metagenome TaxID=1070528 RepID=A0A6H1ZHU8_9ZZZZ
MDVWHEDDPREWVSDRVRTYWNKKIPGLLEFIEDEITKGEEMTQKERTNDDVIAEQECMERCVSAFEKLSRHHYELRGGDSVAIKQGNAARIRVLAWLGGFITDHLYL